MVTLKELEEFISKLDEQKPESRRWVVHGVCKGAGGIVDLVIAPVCDHPDCHFHQALRAGIKLK